MHAQRWEENRVLPSACGQNMEREKHGPRQTGDCNARKGTLNTAVLGISELKRTGMGRFSSGNYKVFYPGGEQKEEMEWL